MKIKSIILLLCSAILVAGCGQQKKKDDFDDLKTLHIRPDVLDKMTLEPINVYDITTSEQLEAYNGNSDNAILTIDKDLNVLDKNNKKIKNLKEINYTDFSNIFCFRINDVETAEVLCDEINEIDSELQDFTIFSSHLDVLDTIKKDDNCPFLRTVYDVTNRETLDYDGVRKTANAHSANILLISQNQIDSQAIRRTQALGKTVWVYCDDTSEADVYTCLISGADGVVTGRINFYISCFNKMSTISGKIMMRTQYNVAHRGLCHTYAENTIAACEAAILSGAEALELDFQKTKDNKIIVMHDLSVNRVTDNDGKTRFVSDLTSEEIRKMQVVKGLADEDVEPQPIPFIEDVVDLLKKYPSIILYAEIKDTDPIFPQMLVKAFMDAGVIDRIYFLHFESLPTKHNMYGECRKYNNEIWGTNLLLAPLSYLTSIKFCMENNCGYDSNVGITDIWGPNYIPYMQKRGLMSFFWSLYEQRDSIPDFYCRDVFAFTNNYADEYGKIVKEVKFDGSIDTKGSQPINLVGNEYEVNVVTYNGDITPTKAKLVLADANDAILTLNVGGYTRYLRAPISVTK